jgi:uncharacterized protein YraI
LTFSTGISRKWLVLVAGLLLGIVAVLPSSASAADSDSPIVNAALRHLGTHGGQCWTFMREVVAEATGRQVGFDYRQGFFDAGAVEVSPDEAVAGDIIQIASDADTSPWASYSGLHTAIIMKNLGNSHFDAIDSNQNWDEMVRLRPDYDPYESAARSGLQVHIYRIPGGGPGDIAASDAGSSNWAAGDSAVVAADPGCLNLRSSAGTDASKIACLPSGTTAEILDGPTAAGGYTWVELQTVDGTGWAASAFLRKISSAAPPTAPPPAADAPAAAAVPVPASLEVRHVDNSPGCLRMRSSASLGGAVLDCLAAGSPVTLVGDPAIVADGYTWSHVNAGAHDGWVASDFLTS